MDEKIYNLAGGMEMENLINKIKKSNEYLEAENERLKEQIMSDMHMIEQWSMLSEIFINEINKACIKYGCERTIF